MFKENGIKTSRARTLTKNQFLGNALELDSHQKSYYYTAGFVQYCVNHLKHVECRGNPFVNPIELLVIPKPHYETKCVHSSFKT